jgi:hypothetical protein
MHTAEAVQFVPLANKYMAKNQKHILEIQSLEFDCKRNLFHYFVDLHVP